MDTKNSADSQTVNAPGKTQDSYAGKIVGSYLSILTKVQCRYEGVVEAFDKAEKTITLTQVKSFGSEGRKGGNDEVPPSQTVHAKVKFRLDFLQKFDIIQKPSSSVDPAIIASEESERPKPPQKQRRLLTGPRNED